MANNSLRKIKLGNDKFVNCFKCKKRVEAEESRFGYMEFFCKPCYKEFSKQARKEVDKILRYLIIL